LADRFWSYVDKTTGPVHPTLGRCWPWKAGKAGRYGSFPLRSWEPKRTRLTHRFAYELTHGKVPDEIVVRHRCDFTLCCNPEHLEVGTTLQNAKDMVSRGRSAAGERSGRSKLTSEQVLAIRRRAAAGEKQNRLAAEYGVSRPAVSNIVRGAKWTCLPVAP